MTSKHERREHARKVARQQREQERRRTKRRRILIQGGIGVSLVAIVALVAVIVTSGGAAGGARPANTAHDAITLVGDDGEISALTASADIDTERSTNDSDVVDITVYADYLCPFCAQFEIANSAQIMRWVADGTARLEYHPIAFLDRLSQGSNYSTRAANAAGCVADDTPNAIPAFNDLLFANQPPEGSIGLTDAQLTEYAEQAGAGDIAACIDDQRFAGWVTEATERSTTGENAPEDALPKNVASTPTIFVDGHNYGDYLTARQLPLTDADAFATFVAENGDVPVSVE